MDGGAGRRGADEGQRCLSVVMPCSDERATVAEVAGRVLGSPFTAELVIVDAGRTYAEGKKIGWRDGVRALWCIARYSPVGGGLPRA